MLVYSASLRQPPSCPQRSPHAPHPHPVLVTKVKVKDDSPNVFVPSASKTEREKNLEKDLEKTTDPTQRRKMREELDALKRDRQRENARNQAEAAQARQTKEANIRQRRLEGGSRFAIYGRGSPSPRSTRGGAPRRDRPADGGHPQSEHVHLFARATGRSRRSS